MGNALVGARTVAALQIVGWSFTVEPGASKLKLKAKTGRVAAAALLLAAPSCTGRKASGPSPVPQANFDREFMARMLHHYDEGAQMLEACLQKAQHQELVAFCRELSDREQEAASSMRNWVAQWFKATPKPEASQHSSEQFRGFLDQMRSSSGAKFEEAFLRAMRIHHRQGLDQTKACGARAAHAELRKLCTRRTGEQQHEERQIDLWICQWFGDCVERHRPLGFALPGRATVFAIRLSGRAVVRS